jgi:hypothetical protein
MAVWKVLSDKNDRLDDCVLNDKNRRLEAYVCKLGCLELLLTQDDCQETTE